MQHYGQLGLQEAAGSQAFGKVYDARIEVQHGLTGVPSQPLLGHHQPFSPLLDSHLSPGLLFDSCVPGAGNDSAVISMAPIWGESALPNGGIVEPLSWMTQVHALPQQVGATATNGMSMNTSVAQPEFYPSVLVLPAATVAGASNPVEIPNMAAGFWSARPNASAAALSLSPSLATPQAQPMMPRASAAPAAAAKAPATDADAFWARAAAEASRLQVDRRRRLAGPAARHSPQPSSSVQMGGSPAGGRGVWLVAQPGSFTHQVDELFQQLSLAQPSKTMVTSSAADNCAALTPELASMPALQLQPAAQQPGHDTQYLPSVPPATPGARQLQAQPLHIGAAGAASAGGRMLLSGGLPAPDPTAAAASAGQRWAAPQAATAPAADLATQQLMLVRDLQAAAAPAARAAWGLAEQQVLVQPAGVLHAGMHLNAAPAHTVFM